jgi:signal peptidase I
MTNEAQAAGTADRWRTMLIGQHPRRTLLRIVILVTLSFLVFGFVLLPIQVTGISMLPTYQDRGFNLINRLAYVFHEPRRGDVVAFRTSDIGHHILVLKRIVGLPGETVAFRNGQLYINGHRMDEPYVRLPCSWDFQSAVGPGEYFVVGDNRSMPAIDHLWGRVELFRIVGKTLL